MPHNQRSVDKNRVIQAKIFYKYCSNNTVQEELLCTSQASTAKRVVFIPRDYMKRGRRLENSGERQIILSQRTK